MITETGDSRTRVVGVWVHITVAQIQCMTPEQRKELLDLRFEMARRTMEATIAHGDRLGWPERPRWDEASDGERWPNGKPEARTVPK